MSVCALSQPQQPNKSNQNQKQKNGPARLPALATGNGSASASASGINLNGKAKGSVTPPTPPPSPQVRIYEDFDRMSAKEVYYNEAGKKVTVKLLHFPDVPPEEISKLKFDDDDDDEEEDGNGGENENGDDDNGEEADEDSDSGRRPTSADSEDAGHKSESSGGASNANALPSSSSKKIFRRKLSGNNMQPRKCSLAFAQAHGIRQRAEKKLSMPTISITANSGEHVAHNCGLRLNLGRKLSQQHSLPWAHPPRQHRQRARDHDDRIRRWAKVCVPATFSTPSRCWRCPCRGTMATPAAMISAPNGTRMCRPRRLARQRDRDRVPHPKPAPPARR